MIDQEDLKILIGAVMLETNLYSDSLLINHILDRLVQEIDSTMEDVNKTWEQVSDV